MDLPALREVARDLVTGAAAPGALALYHRATTMTLVAVVAAQVGNAIASRTERPRGASGPLPPNPSLLLAIAVELALLLAFVHVPFLQRALGTAQVPWRDGLFLALAPFAVFVLEEARKLAVARARPMQ